MANLETWLAEENSIIQKADNEKQVYLYEWLERLVEHLSSGIATNVSGIIHSWLDYVSTVSRSIKACFKLLLYDDLKLGSHWGWNSRIATIILFSMSVNHYLRWKCIVRTSTGTCYRSSIVVQSFCNRYFKYKKLLIFQFTI